MKHSARNEVGARWGCVVLAAGLGTRFGGGKLLAEFGGEPLYELALDAVPAQEVQTAVVSGDDRILEAARRRGFLAVLNDRPEDGLSRSVRLGLEALSDCGAVLFLVADQPLLRRETCENILRAGREHPGWIIAPIRADWRIGNPCLFPAAFFDALRRLEGDHGGRSVIAENPDRLFTVPAESRELTDVDNRSALERLERET